MSNTPDFKVRDIVEIWRNGDKKAEGTILALAKAPEPLTEGLWLLIDPAEQYRRVHNFFDHPDFWAKNTTIKLELDYETWWSGYCSLKERPKPLAPEWPFKKTSRLQLL